MNEPIPAANGIGVHPGAARRRLEAAPGRSWVGRALARGADAAVVGFGTMVALGLDQGGYFSDSWRWATLAFAAITAVGLLTRRVSPGRLEWLSLGALTALTLWTLLSDLWGLAGTEATLEAERCVMYLAALAAFLVLVRRTTIGALLSGVLAGIVALCAYALADRFLGSPAPDPYEGSLLVGPIGYANALGVLAAIGLVLALGLARRPGTATLSRAVLAGAAGTCAVALALTSSRGAWLAAVVGVSVLVLFQARRTRLAVSRRVAALVTLAVAVAAAAAVLTNASSALGDRQAYWRVAVEDAERHPLVGSGAGSFDDVWLERRPIVANVRDAHSLYLESLAELGLVGSILVLGVFAAPIVAALGRASDASVHVATAGLAVYLVHAGLDWDWEMPVTTLAGLACAAAILVSSRRNVA